MYTSATRQVDVRKTTVFMSGNSQAVRLPKDFQLDVREVEILRRGDEIVLRKIPADCRAAFEALASLPPDFLAEGREDAVPQDREAL